MQKSTWDIYVITTADGEDEVSENRHKKNIKYANVVNSKKYTNNKNSR